MIQRAFAERATAIVKNDKSVIGLTVGGSWLTDEMDEFSDLDLILVTTEKVAGDKAKMLNYAGQFGELLSAFTGEHVNEPRLLICLYDNPLLHVDIKFLTIGEFETRVENPVILSDTDGQLQKVLDKTTALFPHPDYQWIEDRFWTWIHYMLVKIERGEYFEALDAFSILRALIFGPLLHIKNGNLPKGIRRVETKLSARNLEQLKSTIAGHEKKELLRALANAVELYRELRTALFTPDIVQHRKAEEKVMEFMEGD